MCICLVRHASENDCMGNIACMNERDCLCVCLYEICSIAGYIDDSMVSGCDCTASPVTSALYYWCYPSARWMRIPPPASTQGPLKDKRGPVCRLTDLPTVFCLSLSHLHRTASHSLRRLCFLAHTNVSQMDTMVQRHKHKVKSQRLHFHSITDWLSSVIKGQQVLQRPCVSYLQQNISLFCSLSPVVRVFFSIRPSLLLFFLSPSLHSLSP